MPKTVFFPSWTAEFKSPKMTKTPPTMPQRLIKNLESELFVFVIFIVSGENSN